MSGFDKSWRDYKPQSGHHMGAHLAPHGLEHRLEPVTPKKRSKYGAVPHCVLPDLRILPADECAAVPGGIRFASKREGERFVFLMLERDAGRISDLLLQEQFTIAVGNQQGVKVIVARYISDFSYIRDGKRVVEDVKSPATRTAVYQLKKHLVEAIYGIEIVET